MPGLVIAGDSLPADAALVSLHARGALSRSFEIDLAFATASTEWSPDDSLFEHVAIAGAQGAPGEPAGPPFHLDGIVHEAGVDSVRAGCVVYALTLRRGSRRSRTARTVGCSSTRAASTS